MRSITAKQDHAIIYILIFFLGLLLFIGLRQLASPWKYLSVAGILLSAATIAQEVKSYKDLVNLFELRKLSGKGYYYTVICILLGLLWGISFRDYLNLTQLPVKITLFALTSMLVGSTEEIIFRGYIQLKLRKTGILWSVTGASGMHTFYKCFVLLVLPPLYYVDYFYFALWTFTMGCLLGYLKEYGRSTWVPVAGHAFFDLIAYGDKMINAWWVWM